MSKAHKQQARGRRIHACARATLDGVIAKQTSFPEAMARGKVKFTGNGRASRVDWALMRVSRMFRDRRAEREGVVMS